MYTLSRLMLVLSIVSVLISGAITAFLMWPGSIWGLALLAIALRYRKKHQHLETLGSARWAEEDDLRWRNMIGAGATTGLIIGELAPAGPKNASVAKLFQRNVQAIEACRQIWSRDYRRRSQIVRLSQLVHCAIFAPTGGGKNVSCVTPFLLECPDSALVVDFKGENFLRTAEHRRKMFGHRIVVLDPFKVVTKTPDCYNPLDYISKESATAIDDCNSLAQAMVIRSGEEREPHFNDAAEMWLAAFLATVVQYGDPKESRSLQTVREFLSNPARLATAVQLMCESTCWGGMLARMGGQLSFFVDKERSSTLTTVSRHLRFLDTLAIAESTERSTFDPAELRNGKMTIYLVLPPEHMRAQSALLRLWISSLLRCVVRGGMQERHKIHVIADEAASLGQLDAIDDALDKYRAFGIRLQLYYQSLGQLRKCYPEDDGQTLLSNVTSVFFGVADLPTAEHVSNRIGETTIILESGGTSTSHTTQWSQGGQPQHGGSTSSGSSYNWQQVARKLLQPAEVMALDPRIAITFAPGVAPIPTRLIRYYEEPWLGKRPWWITRIATSAWVLAMSTVMFILLAGFNLSLILSSKDDPSVRARTPPEILQVVDSLTNNQQPHSRNRHR